jgi:CRP/FNR family cyclic AMP-dependent transcriptional regulator
VAAQETNMPGTSGTFDFTMLASAGHESRGYSDGEPIFSVGDPGTEMYVVKSGDVDIMVGDKVLATVGPGGIFGEMALVDGDPRSADSVARGHCEVVPVDERAFTFLISETPHFALQVMRTLVERLRRMNEIV